MMHAGQLPSNSPRHRLQQVATADTPLAAPIDAPRKSEGLGTPRKSGMGTLLGIQLSVAVTPVFVTSVSLLQGIVTPANW